MLALRRTVVFPTALDKAIWLDGAAKLDASIPLVKATAATICGDERDPYLCAVAIHRFVRDRIVYARDPGGEQFADSAIVLARGWDDCDGKARLFVALCLARGIEARIRPVFDAKDDAAILSDPDHADFVHVQGEIRVPEADALPWADRGWIVAELIVPGTELGQGAEVQFRRGEYTT